MSHLNVKTIRSDCCIISGSSHQGNWVSDECGWNELDLRFI